MNPSFINFGLSKTLVTVLAPNGVPVTPPLCPRWPTETVIYIDGLGYVAESFKDLFPGNPTSVKTLIPLEHQGKLKWWAAPPVGADQLKTLIKAGKGPGFLVVGSVWGSWDTNHSPKVEIKDVPTFATFIEGHRHWLTSLKKDMDAAVRAQVILEDAKNHHRQTEDIVKKNIRKVLTWRVKELNS